MLMHLEFATDGYYWKTFRQECFILKGGEAMEKCSEMKSIHILM